MSMVRETLGRPYPFADDLACQGDTPEITSLADFWFMGATTETRIEHSAAIALGIAQLTTDNSL